MSVAIAPARAADVTWETDASGKWGTASHWSSNPTLPGSEDNVTINQPSALIVTIDQVMPGVRSLFCEEGVSITGDYSITNTGLTIGVGGGWINGPFSLQNDGQLAVREGVFSVNGPTNVDFGEFGAYDSGQLNLPNLTTFTGGLVLDAQSGGRIDVNSDVTIDAPDTSWKLWLDASDGGKIEMQNATVSSSASGGQIIGKASGSGSVVDIRSTKNLTAVGGGQPNGTDCQR